MRPRRCRGSRWICRDSSEWLESVAAHVRQRHHDDASEVVRDALRLMDRQDAVYKLKLERLRELLIQGEQSGDFTGPMEDLLHEVEREFQT
ncbi:MAG: ribbon-helix-helix domain-containing protein [Gammaproteobacteria bacterium]